MRVLLISHFPLTQSESGQHAARIASALQAAGHSARVLLASEEPAVATSFPLNSVRFQQGDSDADATFSLPWFSRPPGGMAFRDLSDDQIGVYREAMRRRLDLEVDEFNPQVIHVQHVWLAGQLALESGAPYVLTAWKPELEAAQEDQRFQPLADQAAENASRILAVDSTVQRQLLDRYEGLSDRIQLAPPSVVENGESFDLVGLYELILHERFGR
jgi:hypothetical protein